MHSNHIIIIGKPPALPGDSRGLTFPGILGNLPRLNRSKFREREQVSHDMDTQVSEKEDLYGITQAPWSDISRVGGSEGKPCGGGASHAGSRAYVDFDSPEVFGGSGDRIYQRKERYSYRQDLCGSSKEFYRTAFLGPGIFCIYSGSGRESDPGVHKEAGKRGSENRSAPHVRICAPPLGGT